MINFQLISLRKDIYNITSNMMLLPIKAKLPQVIHKYFQKQRLKHSEIAKIIFLKIVISTRI
jgi:hypothetical protein